MSRGARYIGEEPCPVSLNDRRPAKGEVVRGADDIIEYLLGRADFEAADEQDAATNPAPPTDEPRKNTRRAPARKSEE